MTDATRGIEYVRRLADTERDLLAAAVTACPTQSTRQIHWTNFYLNGAYTVDHPLRDALHAWVSSVVAEVYDWPEVHVLSYGFITNPAGSTEHQKFHCDYSPTSSNLFVPMTRMSVHNATRFIRQPLRTRLTTSDIFGTAEEILDAEGIDVLEVVQLVCRPFCLLRLLPGTPHAGVPNHDDYDRVALWITVDRHFHRLAESPRAVFYDAAIPRPPGE